MLYVIFCRKIPSIILPNISVIIVIDVVCILDMMTATALRNMNRFAEMNLYVGEYIAYHPCANEVSTSAQYLVLTCLKPRGRTKNWHTSL